MKNRFWEIAAILQKLGMNVQIHRNQNSDGTLSTEWIKARRTLEGAEILSTVKIAEQIERQVPERHSVKIERYATGKTSIETSYHPDYIDVIDGEAARPNEFHIVPCYIPCPVVSDVDEEDQR